MSGDLSFADTYRATGLNDPDQYRDAAHKGYVNAFAPIAVGTATVQADGTSVVVTNYRFVPNEATGITTRGADFCAGSALMIGLPIGLTSLGGWVGWAVYGYGASIPAYGGLVCGYSGGGLSIAQYDVRTGSGMAFAPGQVVNFFLFK